MLGMKRSLKNKMKTIKISEHQTKSILVLLSILIEISKSDLIKNRARRSYSLLKKELNGE